MFNAHDLTSKFLLCFRCKRSDDSEPRLTSAEGLGAIWVWSDPLGLPCPAPVCNLPHVLGGTQIEKAQEISIETYEKETKSRYLRGFITFQPPFPFDVVLPLYL